MLPLMMTLYVDAAGRGGRAAASAHRERDHQPPGLSGRSLEGREYLLGDFTGADVQVSFVMEVARAFGKLADNPNLDAYVARLHACSAYKRALERGGPYAIGQ